ncbi:MAG: formimidoylglutamase [Bdellovibrionota bacterium]
MKILPFDPKSSSGSAGLDDSRLGLHAISINISSLGSLEHGIVILGLADDTGIRNVGGKPGAKDGPAASRARLYKFTTGKPAVPLYDLGDLLPEDSIELTHAAATAAVKAIAAAGHFPLVIGGGHDLGFPHALGMLESSHAKTRFLNIDAHLDVRPTHHGITSGSPWYLLREHSLYQSTKSRLEEFGLQPHCNAHSLVEYAKKHKFGMHWLSKIRAGKKSADSQFAKLLGPRRGNERLLVSLDIDSVQIADAPGCSAPQTLGFQPAEVIQMSFDSGAHARVESFGIFELSPPLDPDGRTALLVAHCINACIRGFSTRSEVKSKR